MSKYLLAVTLATFSGTLIAETSCAPPCEPCCIPEPKKCINCECYTPAYYDLQCGCGFFGVVDFLYWYAKESQIPLALEINTIEVAPANVPANTFGVVVPKKLNYMDSKWCPGFRVGVGFNSECDGWDYSVDYTYYHNTNSRTISSQTPTTLPPSAGEEGILSPWINPFINAAFGTNVLVAFDKVRGKWRLNYNMFDLEIGRKYWLSRCFTLRPFAGIRGGWLKINYNLLQSLDLADGNGNFVQFKDRFRNKFWGVGLLGGFEPTWYFTPCFGLYGLLDFALMWGEFDSRRKERFSYQNNPTNGPVVGESSSNNCFFGMEGAFDLGIGLRYESTYCCDRYRFTLDAGWEHHLWYGIAHRIQLHGDFNNQSSVNRIFSFKHSLGEETDLAMGGLVVRARFDF